MSIEAQVAAFEGGKLRVLASGETSREAVLALPLNRLLVKMVRMPLGEDPVAVAEPVLKSMSPFPDDSITVGCEIVREDGDGRVHFTGDVEWRPEEKAIYKLGSPVELTEREYLLFARLAKSRGECLTPAILYEEVWGETYLASSSNTVIVHIGRR